MPYNVIPLRIGEHREALLKLWRENTYDPQRNHFANERFNWLYESPCHLSRTWVAVETDSNVIVGACSVFRSNKYVRGETVEGGVMNLFVVDAKHRTGAAALAIQRALTNGSPEVGLKMVVAKVGDKKPPIFERVGYQPIGHVQRWMAFIGSGVELPQSLNRSSYTDEIVSVADERFDQLWNNGRHQYQVVSEKTSAFLNWRYGGFKENYRYYCLSSRDDGRLLGYVVFHDVTNMSVVTDLFCQDPWGHLVDDLLHGYVSQMQKDGRKWINLSYFGAPRFEDSLRRLGFGAGEARGDRKSLLAYLNSSLPAEVRNHILQKDNWFFFGHETNILLSPLLWQDWRSRDGLVLSLNSAASA